MGSVAVAALRDSFGSVCWFLRFVTNSSAAQTHLLILKFRAGVVSFLTPRIPRTLSQSNQSRAQIQAQSCHRTLLPLSRTHVLYFLRAYHITHTHTHAHTLCTGNYPFSVWHHKGWAEVNRITYTNYHRHCAPAFKNIFLLISFEVTPPKTLPFHLRQQLGKIFNWDPAIW